MPEQVIKKLEHLKTSRASERGGGDMHIPLGVQNKKAMNDRENKSQKGVKAFWEHREVAK